MIDIKDEILNVSGQPDVNPRYTIRDNNGNVINDNVQIEMKTPVIQQPTPLNKKLFQDFNDDIMNETKDLIFGYTLKEEATQIDINNLDLLADGGLYELILIGSSNYSPDSIGLGVIVNGITSDDYHVRQPSSTSAQYRAYIPVGCGGGGASNSLFRIFNNNLYVKSTGQDETSDHHYNTLVRNNISNVTSISIIIPSNSLASAIESGTQIKLYKRR